MAQGRLGFWWKGLLLVAAVAAADGLIFLATGLGANLGLAGFAWVAALALGVPAVGRDRLGRLALVAAALLALVQIERATAVGWLLFLVAIGTAALAPRAPRRDDVWRWFQRFVVGGAEGVVAARRGPRPGRRARARSRPGRLSDVLLVLALPVLGGGLFLWLFAQANPLIEEVLGALRLPSADIPRLGFWRGRAGDLGDPASRRAAPAAGAAGP